MTSSYRDIKTWLVAFDNAVQAILARQTDLPNYDDYRVVAEPCSRHGGACVWVMYGALVEHVAWGEQEPYAVARKLLGTMLPRPGG